MAGAGNDPEPFLQCWLRRFPQRRVAAADPGTMRPIAVTQQRSPAPRCRLDLILVETHPHGGRQRPPTIQPELEALVRIMLGWDGDAPLVMFTTSFNWRVSAQREGSRMKPTWPNSRTPQVHGAGVV